MTVYLLTWNPAKFEHWQVTDQPAKLQKQSASGARVKFAWSTGTSLKPRKGDRVFLMKVGKLGRGIFGSGTLIRDAYERPDSDYGNAVLAVCDYFFDPRVAENLLDPTARRDAALRAQMWTPQMSGIEVRPQAAVRLEQLWREHCAKLRPGTSSANGSLVTHRFRLRPDLELELALPPDLTREESLRVARYIETLVIPQAPAAAADNVSEVHPRVGLGRSGGVPRGLRVALPAGVSIAAPIRGTLSSTAKRVGSGAGHVDVALKIAGADERQSLVLPAGLVLESKSPSVQHGLLVQAVELEIPANDVAEWTLATYCANQTRNAADEHSEFTIGPVVEDPRLRELFGLLEDRIIGSGDAGTVQAAVWEITDGDGLSFETRQALESFESA